MLNVFCYSKIQNLDFELIKSKGKGSKITLYFDKLAKCILRYTIERNIIQLLYYRVIYMSKIIKNILFLTHLHHVKQAKCEPRGMTFG